LSTTDLNGNAPIEVGPDKNPDGTFANTLGISPQNYDVSERIKADLKTNPQDKDIRIGFGKNGQPSDLTSIGLRTAAYMQGGCADDLLVFVTGRGAASVAADYSGQPANQQQSLRSQSLMVKFIAADRYSIIDNKTGTILADRSLDTSANSPVIEFDGLQLQLTSPPNVGDSYTIDGNKDGLGNNVNMLEMSNLSKKQISSGKTLSELYINQVNTVGSVGQQAKVSQAALQAVKDQAQASRDKVSGVSLDDEAADLIRYQQAYQAAAKSLQVATELFDSIKQIN
jgi:flagellar hook-associated protein FlgK